MTYDSSKTFYQQAAPGSNAVAATTTQGAASIASSAEYQNWQHANFNARQSSEYSTRVFPSGSRTCLM